MRLPAGCSVRPAVAADLEGVLELIGAHDLAFDGDVKPRRAYFDEIWYLIDLEQDSRLVTDASGASVAYAHVFVMAEGDRADVLGRVHPEMLGRGLGGGLVAWTEERAADHKAASARQMLPTSDHLGASLLTAQGYQHAKTWWEMACSALEVEAEGDVPVGIDVRGFRDGDGPLLHQILEDTAADVPGNRRVRYEAWEQAWLGSPLWDPALVWFAEDGGEAVAALVACTFEDGGYVSQLGTMPAYRGRGIARHLLRTSFVEFARRGAPEVCLHVDAANPTGATALYEGAGMLARRTLHLYEKGFAE